MLEKIKSLSLRWKFGILVLAALLVMVVVLYFTLQLFLKREFAALYGDPATKGLFIAELLLSDLKPIIDKNIDSQELEVTVNAYKALYGVYGIRYIFLLDENKQVIVDSEEKPIAKSLIDANPMTDEKKLCVSYSSTNKQTGQKYTWHDCALAVKLPNNAQGHMRVIVLEHYADSPVWKKIADQHARGVLTPLVILALLLSILLTVLLTLAFWYLILKRVMTITQSVDRMSLGELVGAVQVQSQDELGTLEEALDRMGANLKDAFDRIKRRK
ncbi:signal transduction histidine kinase, nitrate/nitrite-specific [Candidatus Moduliflexus flocculans]|uniref:Signal transduction histidine kinase, nitrate/nitrite-specific n=1 Tax=Candidatus Moduliflexus flocculans TaxID=1499966 RepID=A0A081BS52_9BACT|nr:signal transduction histidine kinase, nitrate/nitrite-specific [Candidatus Moduliflexus flocculans]